MEFAAMFAKRHRSTCDARSRWSRRHGDPGNRLSSWSFRSRWPGVPVSSSLLFLVRVGVRQRRRTPMPRRLPPPASAASSWPGPI